TETFKILPWHYGDLWTSQTEKARVDLAGHVGMPISISIAPGQEFAAGSWPHRVLPANAEIDPNSATIVQSFRDMLRTHQGTMVPVTANGIPLHIVDANQPTVRVKAVTGNPGSDAFLQAQWDSVPMPDPDHFVTGGPGDFSAYIYQPSTGQYWEFWLLE